MGESTDKIDATGDLATTTGTSSDSSADADHKGEATEDVAQLRRHIEATRDDLSQTIDALQERLNPATIKQQVTDATIGKAEELAHTAAGKVSAKTAPVARLVKRYPIPSAVAGLVALLLVGHLMKGRSATDDADDLNDVDLDDIDFYGPVYEDDDIELYEYDLDD